MKNPGVLGVRCAELCHVRLELLAGLYPAARLDPLEALRHE